MTVRNEAGNRPLRFVAPELGQGIRKGLIVTMRRRPPHSHAPPPEIDRAGNVCCHLRAGLTEAFSIARHDRDIHGRAAIATARAIARSLSPREHALPALQDCGHFVRLESQKFNSKTAK